METPRVGYRIYKVSNTVLYRSMKNDIIVSKKFDISRIVSMIDKR